MSTYKMKKYIQTYLSKNTIIRISTFFCDIRFSNDEEDDSNEMFLVDTWFFLIYHQQRFDW